MAASAGRQRCWSTLSNRLGSLVRTRFPRNKCEAGGPWIHKSQHRNLVTGAGSNFGVAFDIDGVLLLGTEPIEAAPRALACLHHELCWLSDVGPSVPYVFLTNGGGMLEAEKANELSRLLEVPVDGKQVILGHTPFQASAGRFPTQRVLTVGKGDTSRVMLDYGFAGAVAMDDYVREFPHIDPLAKYKPKPLRSSPPSAKPAPDPAEQGFVWQEGGHSNGGSKAGSSSPVEGVFVLSDPVDWGRDIQVLCDVLRSGGRPGRQALSPSPPLFFAADDFEYQGLFPTPRFGMGAFRLALQSLYFRLTGEALAYEAVGKPNEGAYRAAERALLAQVRGSLRQGGAETAGGVDGGSGPSMLRTIYMVGDNPYTDVLGAKQAGDHWVSILVRTGCHKDADNHPLHPANVIVEDVEEAIHFIAKREGLQ